MAPDLVPSRRLSREPFRAGRSSTPAARSLQAPAARARGARAGMTLIEVLIAVALMSILSIGLFTSLEMGAASWSAAHDALMFDRRIATANALLYSLLASMVPLNAVVPPGSELPRFRFLFFQGEPQSMRFVSSHSITGGARGGLQLTELHVAPHRGSFRVLLNQSDYRGPHSLGALVTGRIPLQDGRGSRLLFRPMRALPTTLIVADRLRRCRFSYFGRSRRDEPAVWVPQWNERNALPTAVRIQLTPFAEPDRHARALPVSISAPVYAERDR